MAGLLVRLVTFSQQGNARAGAVVDGRVLSLDGDVVGILSNTAALAHARAAVARLDAEPELLEGLPRVEDLTLLAPVTPGKIICLGYNYRGHVPVGADPKAGDPEFPDVFIKTSNTLAGPSDVVQIPAASLDVDYEGEIALVIGRRAHEVSLESALDYVAGYALFNDVSDRKWQARQSQWALGKCFDGFGPLGPDVVTADEIADPHDLVLEVVRDGIVTVSQSTSTMIFSMAYVVHYLSTVMTLEPGDIISTGSPQKLPDALEAHRALAHGDSVTIRVAGLGELTTTFQGAQS